ncbi:MAG: hypothetical protein CM1200mP4_0020 [Rhodospirillaceae bacterium]|nr:MAG: hypothetical protein CM1200mP4_0020 [Rhodospirillaceae bacterium]
MCCPWRENSSVCDAGAKVLSVDISSRRLKILKENLEGCPFRQMFMC